MRLTGLVGRLYVRTCSRLTNPSCVQGCFPGMVRVVNDFTFHGGKAFRLNATRKKVGVALCKTGCVSPAGVGLLGR